MDCLSFEELINKEYLRRKELNPRHSLRAFAKFLGSDVSQVSKIMRAKRPLSKGLIQKFGARLGLPQNEIESYQMIAETKKKFPHSPAEKLRYLTIPSEVWEKLDYRYFLLFELAKVKNFQSDPQWISKKLGWSLDQTKNMIDELLKKGLIKLSEEGQWIHTAWSVTGWPSEFFTSKVNREDQEGVLNRAIEALREVPIENRDQSSVMMATSRKKITEAKKLITRFRRDLCAFLEDTEDRDCVYQLGVSLFPMA